MSISPQSHHVGVDASSSTNNSNVSLPKEGCARAVTCCMVCCSQCRRLFPSCGILDGSVDFANNCNASLPREGCPRAVACFMVCCPRRKQLLHSCGVLGWPGQLCTLPSTAFFLQAIAMFTCRFRRVLIEFYWSINMWNMIFQIVNLLVIMLSFWVLPKGRQSFQSTTMLRNECTHTFLYVFGHCGEYVLGLLQILISKSWGGGGFLLHSCLLVPYFSWKYFHMFHHNNTVPTIGRAM